MSYWDFPGFCFWILLCFFWELKAPPIPGPFFRYSVFTDLGIAPHPSNYFLKCWEVSWGQKRRKKKYLFTTGVLWMDKAGISQVLLWINNLCLELLKKTRVKRMILWHLEIPILLQWTGQVQSWSQESPPVLHVPVVGTPVCLREGGCLQNWHTRIASKRIIALVIYLEENPLLSKGK